MKKNSQKTKKSESIAVRLAICEKSFSDIQDKLEHIEAKLDRITSVADMGIGVWKSVFLIGAALGATYSMLRLNK